MPRKPKLTASQAIRQERAIEKFSRLSDPTTAYLLGLLWADGHLRSNSLLKLECKKDDGEYLYSLFDDFGFYVRYAYVKPYTCSDGTHRAEIHKFIASTVNKDIVALFEGFDYLNKSLTSPNELFTVLAENGLDAEFVKGFWDGDGCFCMSKRKNQDGIYSIRATATGSYNQDWTWLEKWLKKNKIKSSVSQVVVTRKNGKIQRYSSLAILGGGQGIIDFGNLIYPRHTVKGLPRKYNKWLAIRQYHLRHDNCL